MVSWLLFVLATIFWCWKMPSDMLYIYAASVAMTAVLKFIGGND
jgi:hypothetical protein